MDVAWLFGALAIVISSAGLYVSFVANERSYKTQREVQRDINRKLGGK
ncbi:hypothetical protein [Convivina intestini]|nr:hypothetical protein [Convivina intestini]CAH1853872.1 hypothetical protein R078131_00853 [Convivina intestini]